MTTRQELRDAVDEAYDAGLCVVPPRGDGSKRPRGQWERFQSRRPPRGLVNSWYQDPTVTGIGIVCGPVSGNLEMLEAEDEEALKRFRRALIAAGEEPLLHRLDNGYVERSPGGGVHWLLRCEPAAPNTVLARRPRLPNEMRHPRDNTKVLLETRGTGGYTVVAPSYGSVHPSGLPYLRIGGSFSTIPGVTPDERNRLWEVGSTLDDRPLARGHQTACAVRPGRFHLPGDSPMERLNAEASWADILTPYGWTFVRHVGDREHWCRPGRTGATSATVTSGAVLYVFSTSTEFDPGRGYSKFAAYAVLRFGGDMRKAARALLAWWRSNP